MHESFNKSLRPSVVCDNNYRGLASNESRAVKGTPIVASFGTLKIALRLPRGISVSYRNYSSRDSAGPARKCTCAKIANILIPFKLFANLHPPSEIFNRDRLPRYRKDRDALAL